MPLVSFATKEEAVEFLKQFPIDQDGELSEDFVENEGEFAFKQDYNDEEEEEKIHPLYKKLFLDGWYYSGNGGCQQLTIQECQFGVPMSAWTDG